MFSLSSSPQPSLYFAKFFPQTPSPLRTLHNANRLNMSNIAKSSPLRGNWSGGDENWSPTTEENASMTSSLQDNGTTTYTNDLVTKTPSTCTPSSSGFTFTPVSTSTSTPASDLSSSSSHTMSLFAYESRARSSSPAAQISRHASDNREQRRTQFLDKIRSRRTQGRDDKLEEKVLQMDYLKERRIWEEEMRRRAAEIEKEAADEVDTEMVLPEVEKDQLDLGGISPTEEREIEELVSYLNQENEDLCDEGYEELFMEMLGQAPSPRNQDGDQMDMS